MDCTSSGFDGDSVQENHIELKQPTLADKPQSNREGVTEGEEEDGRYSCGILLHREGSLTVKGRGEDEEAIASC